MDIDLFPFTEKREKQEEMLKKAEEVIENSENLVTHAPTGLGKCVSGDTVVLTDKGFRRIEDFDENKEINCNSFDEDLNHEIAESRLIEKKESDLLEINTGTGREIKATRDHKILRLKNGEVEWIQSQELEEGDFIASPQEIELPDVSFSLTLEDLDYDEVPEGLRVKFTDTEKFMEYFDEEDRALQDKTDIPRKNFTRIRKGNPVKAQHLLKLLEKTGRPRRDFEITGVHYHNGNRIEIPEIDVDFCYFLGMMLGDGSIMGKRETLSFSTQDDQLKDFFRDMMKNFDSQVRRVHGDDYGYKSSNKSLAWLLQEMGLPSGVKNNMKIPDCALTSRENLSAFISGLLDTDGSVDLQGKLELTTKSKKLSTQLLMAFSVFGIRPTRKEKQVDGSTYYRLFISNQKELEKVRERIGFRLDRKQKRLKKAGEKEYNPNKNVIPEVSDVIKSARENSDIPYSRKTLRRRLESYELGRRKPSEEGLLELFQKYNWDEDEENYRKLQKLLDSDVFWDKVEKIEEREKEKVYDLTVPGKHNFTGNNLILHNTAAALTPALEERIREGKKAFFLTPRNSQHEIALETVRKINERHGENLIAVDLIGKDHLCEADSSTHAGEGPSCPRHEETMQNHQLTEKARKKLDSLKYRNLSAEQVKRECSQVCPYQVLLHMTEEADLIIGDYFHVFHPGVRDIVFEKAETELEDSILVVDEAHNLPSRTRSLFSATISTGLLERCKTETEKFGYYSEQERLDRFRDELFRMSRDKLGQDSFEKEIDKQDLKDIVNSFHGFEEMIVDMETVADEVEQEQEKSFCRQLEEAMEKWKGEDEGFVRSIKREKEEVKVQYSCLDPQISTEKPLNKSHSSILMSGTLTPPKMYVDLLGLDENLTQTQEFGSPFPQENKEELVVPSLTTKYEERGSSMTQKYAWILTKSLEAVPGNAAAFFPSYKMLKEIRKELKNKTDRKIYTETRRMGKEEKQDTLKQFKNRSEDGDGLLLGVAAGSFGEGIDFPGEVLKAAFIIGLPLQRPDLETKALIDFLDERFGKGWDYGYSYPAMNRAIQAAGRCIRSKEDRGVIVYMDKRYSWSNYRKVFPPDTSLKKSKAPWQEIEEFFDQ